MKKIILPLMLLLACSVALADPPDEDVHRPYIPSHGQLYTQFDLGINYSFLDGNDEFRSRFEGEAPTDIFKSGSGLGPLISATIGYEFNQTFGLAFRADYDMRSASNSGSTIDTCVLTDTLTGLPLATLVGIDKEFEVSASYLSLSALAKLRFDKFYLFLGPTISVPLSRELTETEQILDSGACVFFPFTADAGKSASGTVSDMANSRLRASFKIGAGYMIPLTPTISLVPQLAYDFGLTDLSDAPEVNALVAPGRTPGTNVPAALTTINPEMRISSLQATIGLRINL